VLELWALFEFLMPGFLGKEKDFRARFGKALQVSAGGSRGLSSFCKPVYGS
jgi:TATA-binding protein-associated factor